MSWLVAFTACALALLASTIGANARAATAASGAAFTSAALAEIGSITSTGAFVRAGTAFCIGSSAGRSFFVTTHRVAAAAPQLVAILPSDTRALVPVEIISNGTDPDLTILAVGVPDVPHVRLSPTPPQSGDAVTVAGYGPSASTIPTIREGSVSAIAGGGSYFVQYDARTDPGDDGGPLFDAKTGDVVGVIDASQVYDSAPGDDAPPSLYNNLAISIAEAWSVLVKAPVVLDAATSSDFVAHAATHGLSGSAACVNGAVLVGRAYGAWARAHGAIKSVLAVELTDKHVSFASAVAAEEDRERAALADAIPAIRTSGATSSAKLADELASAVSNASAHDREVVSHLAGTSSSGRGADKDRSESMLADAAARVSALYDCS